MHHAHPRERGQVCIKRIAHCVSDSLLFVVSVSYVSDRVLTQSSCRAAAAGQEWERRMKADSFYSSLIPDGRHDEALPVVKDGFALGASL